MYSNQPNSLNPKTFVKTTTVIHTALITGLTLFGLLVTFVLPNSAIGSDNRKSGNDVFLYLVPFMTLLSIFIGAFVFRQLMSKLPEKNTLAEKLAVYQTALIARAAFLEGASMFAIVAYLITANKLFLAIAAINIAWFIWIRPTKSRIEEELSLTYEDKLEMGI